MNSAIFCFTLLITVSVQHRSPLSVFGRALHDPVGMLDAYAWVKRVRDVEGADIIYAHDPDTFKAHKHSPEYYE